MAISINDIAARVGVHKSTVSRTFSRPEMVDSETQQRVLTAARELGYRSNVLARALATRVSPLVPLLVPDISNPFFAELARGAATATEQRGFHLMLCDTYGDFEVERRYLKSLLGLQVRFMIMVPADASRLMDALQELSAPAQSVVLVDRVRENADLSSVTVDNQLGVRLAMEHLLALGHRKIACIGGRSGTLTASERLSEYCKFVVDHGLSKHVLEGDFTIQGGKAAAQAFVKFDDRPSAVIAANDLCAVGFVGGLDEHGLLVPQDVSVVGFDNLTLSAYFRPPLTTVAQNMIAMGEAAVKVGLSRRPPENEGPTPSPTHVRLEPTLVVRGSTAAATDERI